MFNDIFIWESGGVIIIFLLNFLLHGAYEHSKNNPFIAAFAPINESVWEHMKMAANSVFFYSILEYIFIGPFINNFFLAKGLLIITIPILVALLNICYMQLLKKHVLFIDVFGIFIWISLGQILSYRLLTHEMHFSTLNIWLLGASLLMLSAYIIFTFLPPNFAIFKERSGDATTGEEIETNINTDNILS